MPSSITWFSYLIFDFWVLQITFDGDRTLVAFYKFLKKYASIPFKLKKPASYQSSNGAEAKDGNESNNSVKDELWDLTSILLDLVIRFWIQKTTEYKKGLGKAEFNYINCIL